MAENHELRLKIDAAAAKRGSREFRAAIVAVKQAVRDLERDSTGAFTRLNRNIKDTAAASKVKINVVDKRALRDLDSYATLLTKALRAIKATQRGAAALASEIRNAGAAYTTARSTVEAFNKSLLTTNTALARQVQLASQARSAIRQIRAAPTPTASGGGRGADSQTRAASVGEKAAERQIALQNRARRAIDDSRASVEALTTKLMKLGGFETINKLSSAFRQLEKELSSTRMNTSKLDSAKTKFNSTIKGAQTSITTLNAKLKEEQRALRAAATAARDQANATNALAQASKSSATAQATSLRMTQQQERLHLSSAAAMRRAESEAARLTQRLRAMGDTRGVRAINQALIQLRAQIGRGVGSTIQLRTAMSDFASVTNRAKISITSAAGAQQRAAQSARQLATQERSAASQARRLEREMRSVAGASNASSRAFRNATGNMRGLENAFSATFQVGSAFRAMLGSITLGTFSKGVFEAGDALDQFRVTMEVATGSMQMASDEMDFIDDVSRRLGTSLRDARADYSKFAVSASIAGVSTATTRDIFDSVATSLAVLGRGTEDQRLAFMALEQMMSKGTVSSEELRRQLGERLPGAVNIMAQAAGVSTAKLQDMLKAGELISAEVLPKFAKRLREIFGPGLEKAQKRAGTNLRKLQVEFQKFLEAVSQTGLMDSLAAEFKDLTNILRSPETREAAMALGQSFADVAETVTSAAKFIARNIKEIGAVAHAVFVGIVARQAVLIGESLLMWGQRALIAAAAMRGLAVPTTAAEVATVAHTTALNLNTQALAGNAAAAATQSKAVLGSAAASDIALKKAILGTSALNASTAAATANVGAFARVAGGFATAARVIGAISGPIGIAVTALYLLPSLFGDAGDEAEEMGDRIEQAVRRSGVAFEDLNETVVDTTSSLALVEIFRDIDTLGQSVAVFAQDRSRELGGLAKAAQVLRGELDNITFGTEGFRNLTEISSTGLDTTMFAGLSRGAKEAVAGIADDINSAVEAGGGFLELYDKIGRAILSTPTAEPLLRELAEMAQGLARNELALIATKEKLVELYGTESERFAKGFAATALQVVRTGDGLDELRENLDSAIKESPGAAALLKQIVALTEQALKFGTSSGVVRGQFLALTDDSIAGLLALKDAQRATEKQAGEMGQAFRAAANAAVTGMRNTGGFFSEGISLQTIQSVETLVAQFTKFKDASVPLDTLQARLKGVGEAFPIDAVEAWNAALIAQFTSLDAGEQTYANLSRILDTLGKRFDDPRIDAWIEDVRTAAKVAGVAGASYEEFRDALLALDFPTAEARELRDGLIDGASAMTDAERAALLAALAVDSAAASMRDAGAAGHEGAAGVRAISEAFAALEQAQAAVSKIGADNRGKLREMVESSRLTGIEKAVFDAKSSSGIIGKALKEIDKEIATAQVAVNKASAGLPGEFATANRRLAGLYEERRRVVSEGEAAVRTIFENNAENKANSKKPKKSDLEKDLERIRDEAFKTDTALGKLARASDVLNQALSAGMTTTAEATAIMKSLTLQTAETVAEEEDLGKWYLTTTEYLKLNTAEREALRQARIVEEALTRAGIDTLQDENKELIENIRLEALRAAQKEARVNVRNAISDRLNELQEQNHALELLTSGQARTIEQAKLMAAAMAASGGAVDAQTMALLRQVDAAEKLNEALSRAAKDPVKDWLDSVPTWEEAGEKIEVGVINKLSDSIKEFVKTGKFSFADLAASIFDTALDIISDKAMKELYTLFGLGGGDGGEAGILGGLVKKNFNSMGDGDSSGAGQQIQAAMLEAGSGAGAEIKESIAAGSQEGSTMFSDVFGSFIGEAGSVLGGILDGIVNALSSVGGGGGSGGGIGGVLTSLAGAVIGGMGGSLTGAYSAISGAGGQSIGLSGSIANSMGAGLFDGAGNIALPFREGGLTSNPHMAAQAPVMMPASAFHNAPHYAQGTQNTSGIPAVLHDNEAVIPLSRNRKVGVEISGDAAGSTVVNQNFNISTPDADSFRRSQTQIAADGGMAAQRAIRKNT